MKDRVLVGGIAGVAGAVVMAGFTLMFNLIPGVSIKLLYVAAHMFIPPQNMETFEGNVMGFIVHLVCGSLLGVVFILFLDATSYRYAFAKGAAFGAITWFLLCGFVTRLLKLPMQDTLTDSILLLVVHIPFGLTIAWVIKTLLKTKNVVF